ncbi:synaptic vesicle glycoprotein 2B [Halichoerus grypus]|uniref:synaptic vesicle glycoprotein 2B n=1 Tax=Phoca vitulina TaxID=9720 RepID=UPI001395FF13|nr:synaptic vesicle glycoprotein 2B [Phoca vitulina]XP_032247978.1 synaptic vesicle glycoprotein 2B [Phoca vitulina]XP_032247979.1 synaptic vesicle glycoprotein 2B [Phoca vitulina]XP_032247980.1 synaptic vesicle glycoprotein 2B [Phoca vitulina]XP_035952027.1 synaptic vesicle glycoprotein 2B [Halichoerus grypus]XP_035952028.1 synaptic vesicle glycoprotein 2B [Halichoerus grypus]XP_035952029.1 synaptic vesicle glycoprotein 2B [Halichoerus grypus]XP_035952030.1 synaptic vesicle glycoprotein 2B 
MGDGYRNSPNLYHSARDIAREATRQSRNQGMDDYKYQDNYEGYAPNDGYYRGNESNPEEDAQSDVTEGHDEEDEIYEGEYQGIPHPDDVKAKQAKMAPSRADGLRGQADLMAERMEDEEQLAHQYETIIDECGHGRFQWILFFVLGLALMADGVEVFVVSFVLPSAEKDMCLSSSKKGMLGLIVYLGMMAGAFVLGGLADKLGRKKVLSMSLALNASFASLSSFVQGYGAFLFCRLLSGIGIGGALPIVFAYFSEFLSREKRGEHLSWLGIFWMTGGIYASAMAWSIIPHYGWGFSMGTNYHFHSWRVFVIICALPCTVSMVALRFMPESPRFLLEMGKHDEAWMILKQVHDTNMRAKGAPEKVFTVSHIKTPKQMDEFIEIQSSTGTWYQRWLVRFKTTFKQVWDNALYCVMGPYRMNTLILSVVWFTMALSYYGLTVWFPDMIRYFQDEAYKSKMKVFFGEHVYGATINFTMENQIHQHGKLVNDKFTKMYFKHVLFEDTFFDECYFEDVTSTDTYFKNCTIESTIFYNTDLYEHKFINCRFINTSFLEQKEGCHMDFEQDNDFLIYLVSFLGSLSVLPGNIISALLMDRVGRLKMIGGSMLISAVCCFFLFFGNSESAMIGWQCLFCGTSIAAWNALDVITVELYPTNQRATAFGILNGLCKFGAILGNTIFASFVGITKVVPILLAAASLVGGGLIALRLPETREQVLM